MDTPPLKSSELTPEPTPMHVEGERPSAHIRKRRMFRTFAMVLAILLIFGGGVTAGLIVDQAAMEPKPASAIGTDDVPSAFAEAWALVHDRYVDTAAIDDQKLTSGAISGMLDTLGDDGHTRYLDAEQVTQHGESLSGTFVGVGIQVEERDGRIVVVTPLDDSPAQKAGVKPGDVVTTVDGQTIEGQPIEDIVSKIRGPEGSTVNLTFERAGESAPIQLTLQRARLQVTIVSWVMLPGQIADIRLSQFASGATEQVGQAIQAAEAAGATGIVFDLRNNPGGYVHEAIGVASLFLPEGSPVFQTEVRGGDRTTQRTGPSDVRTNLPLVVLVNEGSASASEIVAGALKENGRAKLVGTTTFGTGTLLNQFGLSDGSAILLGTELWLTPNGNLIRGNGIDPDETVTLAAVENQFAPSQSALEAGQWEQDSQLRRGVGVLRGEPSPIGASRGCQGCM
ncbi:MAG: S41 family peptidase [Vicinamibacterales bacterium]